MSFWKTLSNDDLNNIKSRIAANLGDAITASKNYRDGHGTESKIADLAVATFAKKLSPAASKVLFRRHLEEKQHFSAQSMAGLALSPWVFSNDGEGLLTTAIFDSVYRNGPRYLLEAEPDLNTAVTESIAGSMRLLYEILANAVSELGKPQGPQVFYAPTTKEEGDLGSDTLLVGHATKNGRDIFRGVLLQGKVVTQVNANSSVARGPTEWDQLRRLVSTGMGYYAFYHQTSGYTRKGVPAFPMTIRQASSIADEAIESGSLNIHSLADDASDFPSFLLGHVLSEDFGVGRCFLQAEDLFEEVSSNFNIEAVLVVSTGGGVGFDKILRQARSKLKTDLAHELIAAPEPFALPTWNASQRDGNNTAGSAPKTGRK